MTERRKRGRPQTRVYPPRLCRDCFTEFVPRRHDGSSPSARCDACRVAWQGQGRMAR